MNRRPAHLAAALASIALASAPRSATQRFADPLPPEPERPMSEANRKHRSAQAIAKAVGKSGRGRELIHHASFKPSKKERQRRRREIGEPHLSRRERAEIQRHLAKNPVLDEKPTPIESEA